jgi:cyclophilin family peptidyl-prolyl cis-trans isomerase
VLAALCCIVTPGSSRAQADTAAAAAEGAQAPAENLPRMVITTEKYGDIVIELYPDEAPKAVERITSLVKSGFYDGLPFHRVESYVIQTGAVESDLPKIEGEMFSSKLTHEEGMVGMARLPDDYDSAKTQFYICKKHLPLMNHEYTLFGKVVQGLDIVKKIKKGDKIKTITLVQ